MFYFVRFVALLPCQTAEVLSRRSVILTTLFLGRLPGYSSPVLSVHSFSLIDNSYCSSWKNGHRNFSLPNFHGRLSDVGTDLGIASIPIGIATDRAMVPSPALANSLGLDLVNFHTIFSEFWPKCSFFIDHDYQSKSYFKP